MVQLLNNDNNKNKNKTKKNNAKDKKYFIIKSKKYSKCAPFVTLKKPKSKKKTNIIKPIEKNSCLDKHSVKKIIQNFNKKNKNKKINNKSIKNGFLKLKHHYKKKCKNDEICILNDTIDNNTFFYNIKKNFKPIMPREWYNDKNTWLNTLDIEAVLKQYELKYPEFKFFGATPIDFDKKLYDNQCVDQGLCNINIKKLYDNGIRYFGVVFNLDPHDKDGSHWISMFCNLNKCEICFWDSYAYKPPKEVNNLMLKIKKQSREINKDMKIKLTKKRHQYGNSECGIYSTHFIISLLEGNTFEKLTNKRIPDSIINSYRSKYFLPL